MSAASAGVLTSKGWSADRRACPTVTRRQQHISRAGRRDPAAATNAFSRMAQRAHARDRGLRGAIFCTSSATGVTAVGDLGLGPELFAFVTALLAALSFTLELGSVATKHTGFAVDWSRIYQEVLELWTESERGGLSHDEVRASLGAVQRRIGPIDQQSIICRVDPRVLTQCFDQAEAYALAR